MGTFSSLLWQRGAFAPTLCSLLPGPVPVLGRERERGRVREGEREGRKEEGRQREREIPNLVEKRNLFTYKSEWETYFS